jgi:cellulose synthase/poly-beta-1,6-N-acetylglucosamine synthase-like glycosyltransferase
MILISHLLELAGIWFAASMAVTMIFGGRLRRTSRAFSLGWLVVILGAGDGLALFTFGKPVEVLGLSGLALILGCYFCLWGLRDWNAFGQVSWLTTLIVTPLFLAYAYRLTLSAHLSPASFLIAHIFFFIQGVASLLALTLVFENLEVTCRIYWHNRRDRIEPMPGYMPMVSLHIPTYDEPPELVAETLMALARLDYPTYEVLVIDNNTPLEENWHPIEKLCQELGPRFRFMHLMNWPGYKAGALNFALAKTDPKAELIGVIDADYIVEANFLRELVPAFTDPQMAFVQTPQDYRDYKEGNYSEAVYYNYEYFFRVPMPVRNEYNAIIFAGTMGLMRKSVLQEIGGWDEWCITEDAEASLRILKLGYKSLFYQKSMGRGLMPCTFDGLKKQRFRWCFGNVQILRKHWEALMPWAHWADPRNQLTASQRYFYLAGCLQWFTDAFNFIFVCFLMLGGVIKLLSAAFTILQVTGLLMTMAFLFTLLNLWRFGWVLSNTLKPSWSLAFRSMYGMFSVGWVIALACLQGLIESRIAFLRTPKKKIQEPALNALFTTQWEVGIGVACLAMAIAVFAITGHTVTSLFISGFLFWQSSLYMASPVYSLFYKSCPD